jgi:hypothetical protein
MSDTTTQSMPATDERGEPTSLGRYNGFEIYPMPLFITLVVDDPVAMAGWYERALGFGVMLSRPFLVHLRRRKYQDVLLVPAGAGAKATTGGPSLHFNADGEVDALAERASAAGGVGCSSVEAPVHTPWNTRELRVVDPAGHRLVFTSRPSQPSPELHEPWRARFADPKAIQSAL